VDTAVLPVAGSAQQVTRRDVLRERLRQAAQSTAQEAARKTELGARHLNIATPVCDDHAEAYLMLTQRLLQSDTFDTSH
jgi:hypothetical protein